MIIKPKISWKYGSISIRFSTLTNQYNLIWFLCAGFLQWVFAIEIHQWIDTIKIHGAKNLHHWKGGVII
jgi:hypothetical protein